MGGPKLTKSVRIARRLENACHDYSIVEKGVCDEMAELPLLEISFCYPLSVGLPLKVLPVRRR